MSSPLDTRALLVAALAHPSMPCPRQRLRQWSRDIGHTLRLPAGAVAVQQGEIARHVMLLESGQALLRRSERSGMDVAIAWCDDGTFLDLASAVHGAPHAVSAVLRTDGEIVSVETSRFIEGMAAPGIGTAIVGQLAADHVKLVERYGARAALSVRDRVLAALAYATPLQAALPWFVRLSTMELANLVAADQSSVCRILRELKAEGLIDFARGRIAVRTRLAR